MTRQVDIKALISHLVRGDGTDKCRICMGDTSDGQVYLGDTVMVDGERLVTLAELLEQITGVEVTDEEALPLGLCKLCFDAVLAAHNFRTLCKTSRTKWSDATDLLSKIRSETQTGTIFFLYDDGIMIFKEKKMRDQTPLELLNAKFDEDVEIVRRKHKRSPAFNCSCPDCEKSFTNVQELNDHLKNSLKSACQSCALVTQKKNIPAHMKIHNVVLEHCKTCFSVFEDLESVKNHWLTSHGPHTYSCKTCGAGFSSQRALRSHMYSHTLFYCNSCSRTFENRKCFKHHQRGCKTEVSTQSVYICDYCNLEYNKKPSLKVHIIQKHLNVLPYVCQKCGKRASTKAHLLSHLKTHNHQKSIFQCHCGAKMTTELGYRLHQRIHSGEKPYECKRCGERFLSSSRRLDHIKRRHMGSQNMPHACDKCPAKFLRPWELKKHYSTIHSIVIKIEKTEDAPLKRRFKNMLKD